MAAQRYTEDEARAMLPQVIPVVERIKETFQQLQALQARVSADERRAFGDGNLVDDPWQGEAGENELERLKAALTAEMARLERWGIELKDPERGLIDFYSERNGRVVYLCYLLGEPDLAFWHGLRDGFAGRQPL